MKAPAEHRGNFILLCSLVQYVTEFHNLQDEYGPSMDEFRLFT